MADRRIRDLRRLLQTVAEPYGAAVVVEHTRGNHLRGVFTIGTRQTSIITAHTPSDWRVSRKVQSDARRKLRALCGSASPASAWRSAPGDQTRVP
jgi:hypothetical protein